MYEAASIDIEQGAAFLYNNEVRYDNSTGGIIYE